ncbi:serine/threonine-protein kinase [Paraliomyxa miuraensis]|uniref:serine/threonine-protein kinase n=1 Tax=Paraliomyxa miuraensis TaxID=376150 RepID=UPI002254DF3B|nr:serine/threonine-protein kinase [Paraliomyxa miuraensis]MCX4246041.1 serine/threonine-protein kinase [Paraliomyxa miuraensis]
MKDSEPVITTKALPHRPQSCAEEARTPSETATLGASVPSDQVRVATVAREHSFRVLGRYEILGRLGCGAMGTVLEAFDPQLDRRVALKILHHEHDTPHNARLLREAKALAKLSHPNVVQVYEVGQVDGRTFVAMELVEGRTLDQWMQQEPRPKWRACVQVFIQVGMGLAAAHEQGMVHRDFKPSNAMIDGKGRARVLDFGLARESEESEHDGATPLPLGKAGAHQTELEASLTRTGAILGTPAYMPPEQMLGREADARSDQFSFCVALYEAVYGRRPYDARSMGSLMHSVMSGRIALPKGTGVPGRLGQILLRGLATDPQQRWTSMEALLEALRRLIAPRRGRWLALGSTIGLATIGAGLFHRTELAQRQELARQAELAQRCSSARIQLDGIWDDARRRQLEEVFLGTGLSYASDTWERVANSLDEYADCWVNTHTEVCEATSLRQEQSAAVMDLRMGCLRQHRVALREVVDLLLQADPTRVKQAVTLVASLPALARCDDVETLQAKLPPPQDPRAAEKVEALRDGLAQVRALRSAGVYDDALANAESIVVAADDLGHAPLQAEAVLERGLARQDLAQYDDAARDLEQAYLLAIELEHFEVEAAAVRELAFVVGHDQARHEAGLQWSKTALALTRRPRADPREQATVLSAIGVMLLRNGELDDALAHQQQALAIFEAALGPEHPDIADLRHNMGNVLRQQGKLDEALSHLQRALAIREQTLGPGHPDIASPLTTIGAVLDEQGHKQDALLHLQRALAIREQALGASHPDVATSLNNIGIMYKQQGKLPEALESFERALTILEASLGPTHPRLAYPLNNLGEVLRARGEQEHAVTYYQRALTVLEQSQGSDHPNVASSMINLGNLLYEQKRYEEAEHHYQRALEIQQRTLPEDHPHQAWPRLGLAKIDLGRGRIERAREQAEQAVAIREQAGVAPVLLAEGRFVLARTLWNDPTERSRARSLAERAREAWASAEADDPQTREYLSEVELWLAEHPTR